MYDVGTGFPGSLGTSKSGAGGLLEGIDIYVPEFLAELKQCISMLEE